MAKRGISFSGIVTIRLNELARVAAVLIRHGEVLDARMWLMVLANILAAADTRDTRTPRPYRQLTRSSLSYHLDRCGVVASDEEIDAAIEETREWRKTLVDDGRSFRPLMSADTIGLLLGITDAVREEAKSWNLGTYGGSRAARAKAKRERDRMSKENKRRSAGAMSRTDYEANSLSRTKPWEAEGVSRRTWYARQKREDQKGNANDCTSPALHKSGAPIHDPLHKSGAPILDTGTNASSRSPLEASGSKPQTVKAAASIGDPCQEPSDNGHGQTFPIIETSLIIHGKRGTIRVQEALTVIHADGGDTKAECHFQRAAA